MAGDRKPVLLLACDSVFFGDQLAGHAHVKIFISVPQAVVNHRIHDLGIAEAIAGTRLRQKIRAVGHGFHATGDDDFRFTQLNGLRGERDRF